jgi:hypothetical protein
VSHPIFVGEHVGIDPKSLHHSLRIVVCHGLT